MQRRNFLGALFCAPAIVKAENIMRVKPLPVWTPAWTLGPDPAAAYEGTDLTQANLERALKEVMAEGKPIRMGFKVEREGDLWVARAVPVSL